MAPAPRPGAQPPGPRSTAAQRLLSIRGMLANAITGNAGTPPAAPLRRRPR
jgi:hypothetical protein